MRELEVVPGTVLLACQSKTDATLEKTGKTITANGNAVANELTPGLLTPIVKSGGGSAITGSVEFDGSGSTVGGYLEVTPDDDLQFLHKCTDSYTIEAWVHKQASTDGTIFDNGGTSSTTIGIVLFGDSGGVLKFRARQALSNGGFHSITTGDVMANDMWHHVALTYDKSTVRLFVNGILAGSTSYNTESSVDSTQSFKIGAYEYNIGNDGYFNGHISNFRVVKGTALYTDDFIPPTRELKRVPGTVLLACQDPDNPLTEATGKTITGYGDLHEATDVEMLTNGSFAGGYSTEWEAKNSGSLSHANGELTVTSTQNYSGVRVKSAYLPTLVSGRKYAMTIDLKSITNPIRFGVVSGGTKTSVSTAGRHTLHFTGQASTSEIFIEKPDGSNSTFVLKSVSIRELNTPNRASNFTPQVGDDRQITFEGVTKINTDAYFYLPTGNTASRTNVATQASSSGRGLHMGGGSAPITNTIEYITISSKGDSQEFGDLTAARYNGAAFSSATRGIYAGGLAPTTTNLIEYITIASTGNGQDFGDLTLNRRRPSGCSNSTRGFCIAGRNVSSSPYEGTNLIDYVTIQSTGNAQDFGDLTIIRYNGAATSSPTRGIFSGGYLSELATQATNNIEYITLSTTGNAVDFGNLITKLRQSNQALSSNTRGIFPGGGTGPQVPTDAIDYVTIASTGDAIDFGDMIAPIRERASSSNSTRGVFTGGFKYPSPGTDVNDMDYITIASTGNSQDFGDLNSPDCSKGSGCSDSHGGLG
jgi:hypothetical protein